MGRGEAEFYYTGAGGVVGLEAMCGALGAFHGVDGLEFFDWLAHIMILVPIG